MLWLMIGLLVSLVVLLIAAAGVARHIWLQRARLSRKPPKRNDALPGAAEETDIEAES
jgi:Flp pilus assembly protein TadB